MKTENRALIAFHPTASEELIVNFRTESINSENCGRIKNHILSTFFMPGRYRMFDFENVSQIDRSGLKMLQYISVTEKPIHSKIIFFNVSQKLRAAFQSARLEDYIEVYSGLPEAA